MLPFSCGIEVGIEAESSGVQCQKLPIAQTAIPKGIGVLVGNLLRNAQIYEGGPEIDDPLHSRLALSLKNSGKGLGERDPLFLEYKGCIGEIENEGGSDPIGERHLWEGVFTFSLMDPKESRLLSQFAPGEEVALFEEAAALGPFFWVAR